MYQSFLESVPMLKTLEVCVCVCVCVLQFSCVVVLRVVVVCEEFKLFHTLPLLGGLLVLCVVG